MLFFQKSSSREKSGKPSIRSDGSTFVQGPFGGADIPTYGVLTDHQAELEKVMVTWLIHFGSKYKLAGGILT